MEAAAKAVKEKKIKQFSVNVEQWILSYGVEVLSDLDSGNDSLLDMSRFVFPKEKEKKWKSNWSAFQSHF